MQAGGRLTGYMRILTGSQNGARRLSFEHISDVEKHRKNGTFAKDITDLNTAIENGCPPVRSRKIDGG